MLVHPPKASPGDRVAVVSAAFAAPAVGPAIHEQAMRRLVELTGLEPVEYPTTRRLGATAEDRAADLNAAFADPSIRAIVATIGGDDQVTVIPHLDGDLIRRDPKPFVGYSDNTNLHDWLWRQGVASFYGGSTQVHLGSGPGSILSRRRRCAPRCSTAASSSSPSPASPRTSASTGATPGAHRRW